MSPALLLIALGGVLSGVDNPGVDYLSDVWDERVFYHTQGWGQIGINTAVRPTDGREPQPLRIKDTAFEKGLGHHAPGEIVVELNGEYVAFEAEVGVQWQSGNTGTVVFQVFVDDEKRFDSDVMKEQDAARPVRVPVAGASSLRLVVTDAGDGITCDCANWANARVVKAEILEGKPVPEPVDMAPFARVVTWDPDRNDGARSNRVQEFRAEDVFLEKPVKRAAAGYVVPAGKDGKGCIGLQWAEPRMLRSLALEFGPDAAIPSSDGVRVQYWTGESPWQGSWKPFNGTIAQDGNRWTFAFAMKDNPDFPRIGTEKVRWIFPRTEPPVTVKQLSALTRSHRDVVALRVELEKPVLGQEGHIEIYNGGRVSAGSERLDDPLPCTWDLGKPLSVKVWYTRPRSWKSDRTTLRFTLPGGACGVAVEDVLAKGCVYVRGIGLYVAPADSAMSVAEYRASIAGRKSLLEQVRERPDQTFAQAIEKVHNPAQDNGPTMLSLACDNHKFIAHRDGAIQFEPLGGEPSDKNGQMAPTYRFSPRFGAGKSETVERRLYGDWLPAPMITVREDKVVYRQTTFVAPAGNPVATAPLWLNERPVCVAHFMIENEGDKAAQVSLAMNMANAKRSFTPDKTDRGAVFAEKGQTLALLDTSGAQPLTWAVRDGAAVVSGELAPHASAQCSVFIPGWEAIAATYKPEKDALRYYDDFSAYWTRALADAVQVDVPDALLANVIRASQVHCLLAARNEQAGTNVAAWIASDRYGPLESEAHSVILGMDLWGQREYAQRALDFFIKRYNAQGYLTTGYTIMGTGWHLWTLARHFALTDDRAWFTKVAPEVSRVCQWINQQRIKTKQDGADLEQTPECGLIPPGVAADWNRFGYRFSVQAHFYAGLHEAAQALAGINYRSTGLLESTTAFHDDLLRAYRWNQAKIPAWSLPNGEWIPAYGSMLRCFGFTEEGFPGEDGNRSWAYNVEIGSHHLVPLGVLDAQSDEVAAMMDHMEEVCFLHSGMGDYPADKNHADWFNLGGFAKVQPYYARCAEIYAARDDVKPFIRSYFNAIPSLLSLENLSFWEHFHNQGAWNKTHETGWFLVQTRTMLVQERADELWLAPFVTNQWMQDGMAVSVKNAPTRFGPVTYRIASAVGKSYIEATVEPPGRTPPKKIVVRLRHPLGLPIQSVSVNGMPHSAFDPKKECVFIEAPQGMLSIRAQY